MSNVMEKTAQEGLEVVLAEARKNNTQAMRFQKTLPPADSEHKYVIRQGDVYLIFVDEKFPKGKKVSDRQLVPGMSKGSRHCAGDTVEIYQGVEAPVDWKRRMKARFPNLNMATLTRELMGPRLFFPQRDIVTHPEHAHVSVCTGAHIQVMYQLNAKTMKRAAD